MLSHCRRLVKNVWGGNVVIADESMGISQLLGAHA